MSRVYTDNSQSIGNTPLVRLNRVVDGARGVVLARRLRTSLKSGWAFCINHGKLCAGIGR